MSSRFGLCRNQECIDKGNNRNHWERTPDGCKIFCFLIAAAVCTACSTANSRKTIGHLKGDPACPHTSDALRAKKVVEWKAFVQKSKEDAGLSRGDSLHCNFCAKSRNPKLSSRAQTHNTHHEDGSVWCFFLSQQKCEDCEEAGRDPMGHMTGHWSCPLKTEDQDEELEEDQEEDLEEDLEEAQEEAEEQGNAPVSVAFEPTVGSAFSPIASLAIRPASPLDVEALRRVYDQREEQFKEMQSQIESLERENHELKALERENQELKALERENQELKAQDTRQEASEIHQTMISSLNEKIESLEKELKKTQRELLGFKAAYNAVLDEA